MPTEQEEAVAVMERDRNEALALASTGKESRTEADEAAIELQKRRDERSSAVDDFYEKDEMPDVEAEEETVEGEETEKPDEAPPAGDDLLGKLGIEQPEEEAEEEVAPDAELTNALAEVDGIEEPARLSAKGKEGWSALKGKTSELTKEVHSLKQQLSTASEATGSEAFNAIKAESEELKNQLSVLDYESSDDFKTKFSEPERRITEALDATLKGTDVTAAQLLAMPETERDTKIDELAESMSKIRGNKLVNFVTNMDALRAERGVVLTDVQGKLADIRSGNDAKVQARAAEKVATYDGVQKRFLADTGTLFSPFDLSKAPEAQKEFQTSFNAGLEKVNADARHLGLAEDNPEALALGSMKAASFDFVMENVVPELGRRMALANAEIVALKKEVAGYIRVKPGSKRSVPAAQTAEEKAAAARKVPVRQRIRSEVDSIYGRR